MAFLGNLNIFDHKIHEWDIFFGKMSQFIKLNGIAEENQRAVLLTHFSDESYRLLRDLVHPKKLEDLKYSELVKVLNRHFTPKRSTFADRAKFYEASRSDGESIEDWVARLRGLAAYCEFGMELDTLLRDRFVLGFRTGHERDKLFECDFKTLSLTQAVEVAQKAACARQACAMGTCNGSAEVTVVREEPFSYVRAGAADRRVAAEHQAGTSTRFRKTDNVGNEHILRCAVCGLKNHNATVCRFKNFKCLICGQRGHLKKLCGLRKSDLHNINTEETSASLGDCKDCKLFNLRYVDYNPIKITVKVNDVDLCMELDTGSGCSVISRKLYLFYFSDQKLHSGDLKMCLYNGHNITPIGYFVTKITYLNACKSIKIYVIENGGPPLLGRDFMKMFSFYLETANNNISFFNENIEEVKRLLKQYPAVWKDELGCFNKFEIELKLKDTATPKFFKPRTVPFALKDKVTEELDRLVSLGILIPVSFSEYATPIVPVLKENGKLKIAGDFSCTLNKDLEIDKYPLPRIEEVFSKIGGGEHYSKIDLSNAYNQFKLSKASQKLTTINTQKGLFSYTRLVYGLACAPAIFQKAMEMLLADIEGVSVWLDDICITGPTKIIHLSRLQQVLCRLQDAGLRLQKEKCVFFEKSVTYLGYVIDKSGLRTSPTKVDAIIGAPAPSDILGVKRFLGVVNYYRNFIPGASTLLSPLHELLRSGAEWLWGERQQAAFDSVKRALASERVLAHFDPDLPLVLTVDASPCGLGAVLAHRDADGGERPIAFASRSLAASEKNYSQIQKEATAIIFGVKHFHQYLYGRQEPFILKTDHRPLLSIFGKGKGVSVTAALRLQRYAIILSAYNFTVKYIDGKNNEIADYFSRAPLSVTANRCHDALEEGSSRYFFFLEASVEPVLFSDIKRAIADDDVLQTVVKYMNIGWPKKIKCKSIVPYFQCKTDLELIEGCLFRGHRIVIPTVYRVRMLRELHSAHFGIIKTKSAARSRMWWPGIDGDIERWVGACAACAAVRSAPPSVSPAPWPRPAGAWHRIHIDYMSIGQAVYLIVVDAFSKWLECIYMDRGTTTGALIEKLKQLFCMFGMPYVIVSDNDIKISSAEFNTFCKINGIEHLTSPIYHPASNGQAENSVKICKKIIRCMLAEGDCQKVILEKLQSFLFNYRNTIHCATGVTPAMLMLGRNLRCRLDLILPKNRIVNSLHNPTLLNRSRSFQVGETVWARWFIARKSIWSIGIVNRIIGTRMFEIYFKDIDTVGIRHVDQMRKFYSVNTDNGRSTRTGNSTIPTPSAQLSSSYPRPLIPDSDPIPESMQAQATAPPIVFPSFASEDAAGEKELRAVSDDDRNYDSNTDNVEWEDACGEIQEEDPPVPTEREPDPDRNAGTSGSVLETVERSLRPRKPTCYKKYF